MRRLLSPIFLASNKCRAKNKDWGHAVVRDKAQVPKFSAENMDALAPIQKPRLHQSYWQIARHYSHMPYMPAHTHAHTIAPFAFSLVPGVPVPELVCARAIRSRLAPTTPAGSTAPTYGTQGRLCKARHITKHYIFAMSPDQNHIYNIQATIAFKHSELDIDPSLLA